MIVAFGAEAVAAEWPDAVVCVGTFDGVHVGHARVIGRAVARAREGGRPAVVLTFDRHPAEILSPARAPSRIATLEDNLRRFAELGLAAAVVLPFDAALSRMSADAFFERILRGALRAGTVVIGHDFAFGNGREGDAAWLAARTDVEVVPPIEVDGERVSSSGIRAAVAAGDLRAATRALGRPFRISGAVIGGQRLGRTIGYPTLNLARIARTLLPPDGVYAAVAEVRGARYGAALSIGTRPAVGGRDRTIEAYLLDYPGDEVYGEPVSLDLLERLRDEWDFPSLDALKEQIGRDVERVRSVVGSP